MKLMGVDEAGRGPLLGPLVICGAIADESVADKLRLLGVKDSKLISPKKREELVKILPEYVTYALRCITPSEIDAAVFSETTNLNWLEADNSISLIEELVPDKVILDCPSPNTIAYANYLKARLKIQPILAAEHKADVKYAIVAAASILAKVARDAEITKLKVKIGIDFGSGYPSDPKTKEFLKNYWNKYPELFRKSWAPYKKVSGKIC